MRSSLLPGLLLSSFIAVNAGTITATDATANNVQFAINIAITGDTVVLPAGLATWNSGITLPGTKGITLDGTGVTITRGAAFTGVLIAVTTNATTSTRITGFTFNQTTGAKILTVGGGFTNARFRVDHCTLSSTSNQSVLVQITNSWGLIDNCSFTGDQASEMLHNEAWGPSSTAGWSDVVTPGGPDALYIEDCTFSKYNQADPYFWGTSALQSYYGARTVVRHCTLNYCQIDQHGTAGNIGARWWEIYENTFVMPASGSHNQSNYMAIRAGSGVIFNNSKTGGANAGGGGITLYEEDTGYPALYQIGRGQDSGSGEILDPAYCWGNTAKTPNAGSTNVVDGRDFYSNTVKPGYTPYLYPHPMRSGSGPPTNAKVLITTP